MSHITGKPLAILSATLLAIGAIAAGCGLADGGDAYAVNTNFYSGSSSSDTTTTIPTTSADTTEETTTETVTNPNTADDDWIMIAIALGIAGLAFSGQRYFARH